MREGGRAAFERMDLLEARAKLRGALQTRDSPPARALWWQLSRTPLVLNKRLGAAVYDVAFSADERYVAAACQEIVADTSSTPSNGSASRPRLAPPGGSDVL